MARMRKNLSQKANGSTARYSPLSPSSSPVYNASRVPLIAIVAVVASFAMFVIGGVGVSGGVAIMGAIDESKEQTMSSEGKPPSCTSQQKERIRSQLSPELCRTDGPSQGCSICALTSCPLSTSVERYYQKISSKDSTEPFLAVSIGCNKAIEAVETLRMGSRDPKYDLGQWKTTLLNGRTPGELETVCNAFDKDGVDLDGGSAPFRSSKVYCIEPVPKTVDEVNRTAQSLGWTDEIVIKQAVMSSTSGHLYVPTAIGAGHEGVGIVQFTGDCERDNKKGCLKIPMYNLDDFPDVGTAFLSKNTNTSILPPIHVLSIDTEGFDFEVLKGAAKTLPRVHYLEFEYHKDGLWANQSLKDAISLLDELSFTCYWLGPNLIWRISGCWMDYFDFHEWSNVACVNHGMNETELLLQIMEEDFEKTLTRQDVAQLYK